MRPEDLPPEAREAWLKLIRQEVATAIAATIPEKALVIYGADSNAAEVSLRLSEQPRQNDRA